MDNRLSIYQGNTKTVAVLVNGLAHTDQYQPYISIKRKATDVSTLLFKAGTSMDNGTPDPCTGTLTFNFTSTDTSMAPYDYVYDITVTGNSQVITLVRDKFSIMENVYN